MLTQFGDLKAYLNVSTTTEDTYLAILQTGVEEAFKGLCDFRIEQNNYTEYYDGNNTTKIPLRQVPVISVASVYLDSQGYYGQGANAFPSTTLLTAGTDYYVQYDGFDGTSMSGILVRINTIWPGMFQRKGGDLTASRVFGQGNIKVTYSAGYKIIPADVQQAIFEACKELRFRRRQYGPITGESLAEYSYTAALLPIDYRLALMKVGTMEQIIARYRKFRIQ